MIDWLNLAANSLWILGCATGLAAFSIARWEASTRQVKVRQTLQRAGYQAAFNCAGLLFCLGLAGLSKRWWEVGLWVVLVAWFAFQLALPYIRKRFSTP